MELVRGKLPKATRITLGAIVTIDVHARDVVDNLVKLNLTSEKDFDWLCQMRYYWEENRCVVRMITTAVVYGCEYLGNSFR